MELHESIYEQIERYSLGLMTIDELERFENELHLNPALKKTTEEYQILLQTFEKLQNEQYVHDILSGVHIRSRNHTSRMLHVLKIHINKYWKTASVAASVAIFASILTFMLARSVYKKDTKAQVQLLRNEINTLKKDQKDIKNEVDNVKKIKTVLPDYPSKYSGTAFAISKSGYLVTNKHVVNGYEKIYALTYDHVPHMCTLLYADADNDIAILKITEDGFSFPDRVPYSIKKANPGIAQRVYTLGFPKSDIVYNEGYISSLSGFEGDSLHYQLELPVSPGVSGAPVIDETGNILGIISGKQTQSVGITFAVKSKALLNAIKVLPKDFSHNEINSNVLKVDTRANQVKKIQPFICEIKVYNN